MSITIAGYDFEGPYSKTESLFDISGVYAILCSTKEESIYAVIDVGESSTVKSRVENHDRNDCWRRNCNSKLYVAVYYTPNLQQAGRMLIEQEIRRSLNAPCGKQ